MYRRLSRAASAPASPVAAASRPAYPALLPHPLARTVRGALIVIAAVGATAVLAAPALAQPSGAAATAQRSYDIPAGSLAAALTRFSSEAGIYLAGTSELAQGKSTSGLRGRYSVAAGLDALLAGSGLRVIVNPKGQYVLQSAPENAAPAQLPTVNVDGSALAQDPYSAQALNPPTTVASKIPLTQREIPQTVSVMTQQEIQQRNLRTLDEAMKRTPGVVVLQSDADRVQYYSRGFPISSLMIDGLPVVMNPDMSSTAATNAPNLAMYERVEVLDGPAGLFGGFGSVGGVVSLVRKRAPSQFTASVETSAGTKDTYSGTVDIGSPLNASGTLRGRLVASAQRGGLDQDGTWRRNQAFYGTLEADLSDNTLLRTGISYDRRDSNVGWAGQNPLYDNYKVVGGRNSFYGASWNRDRYTNTNAFVSLEHRLSEDWKLTLATSFDRNTARVYSAETFGMADLATNTAIFGSTNTDYHEDNNSVDANLTGKYTLFGRKHDLTVGANFAHMYNTGTSYYGSNGDLFNFQTLSISDHHFDEPAWSGLPEDTSKGTSRETQYGIYGNTRYHLTDALTAIAGARLSWWDTQYRPDAVYNPFGNVSSAGRYKGKVTPYGGLIYDLNDSWSAYGSYSTIFQPQVLRDESGNLLKPMEGDQYEVGLKGSHLDGRLQTGVALFQVAQKNRATATDQTGLYFASTGRARSRGVDLRASGLLMPGWTLSAGYTYTDSKYLDKDSLDTAASAFSQISPRHLFKLWSNYRLPGDLAAWEVGGGVSASSKLYGGTGAEKIEQGAFYTVDARLAYKVNDHVTVALNGTNLFDRKYFTPLTTYQGVVYGQGRRVLLTVRSTF